MGVAKNIASSIVSDAGKVAPRLKNLVGLGAPEVGPLMPKLQAGRALLKNRAVQAGAATLGTGVVVNKALSKQASKEDNEAWKATGRALSRGTGEALAGGLTGNVLARGLNSLARNVSHVSGTSRVGTTARTAGAIGASLGNAIGGAHGIKASLKNTAKAAREKQAAFTALIESGVDFNTAAALVKQAEIEVYGN